MPAGLVLTTIFFDLPVPSSSHFWIYIEREREREVRPDEE
jgi:hypothetical protein